MTHPFRRQTTLAVAASKRAGIFAFALFATLSNGVAAPADPINGERLAKQWCASCHIVSADQTRGADNVPAFATIAKISWLQRAEHRAISLGSASQDAGHATDAKRGQRPRRLYRKSRAVSPLAQEIEGRAS